MEFVEGVPFTEEVAPLVRGLVEEARHLASSEAIYKIKSPELRASVVPKGSRKASRGVFMRILSMKEGAILKPSLQVTQTVRRYVISAENLADLKMMVGRWYSEVRDKSGTARPSRVR